MIFIRRLKDTTTIYASGVACVEAPNAELAEQSIREAVKAENDRMLTSIEIDADHAIEVKGELEAFLDMNYL